MHSRGVISGALLVAMFAVGVLAAPVGAKSEQCVVTNEAFSGSYATLQEAIDAATAGDELTVDGRCVGNSWIRKDLTISGKNQHATLDGDNNGTVVGISLAEVTLYQLVITNGSIGIESHRALNLIESTVSGNTGTGIYNSFSTLNVVDSTVSGNGGNGISTVFGRVTLTDSIVSANSRGGISAYGEGVGVDLVNSTVTGNSGASYGGGISVIFGNVTLTNSTVSDNSATLHGGGIYGVSSGIFLNDSTVRGNSAASGGGVSNETGSTFGGSGLWLNVSKVINNTATGDGGGIFNGSRSTPPFFAPSTVHLNEGSRVSGNSAGGVGGGIFNNTFSLVLFNGGTVIGNRPDDIYQPPS